MADQESTKYNMLRKIVCDIFEENQSLKYCLLKEVIRVRVFCNSYYLDAEKTTQFKIIGYIEGRIEGRII